MNLLIIGVILCALWWFFFRKKRASKIDLRKRSEDIVVPVVESNELKYNLTSNNYPLYDESKSNWYREVNVPFFWERKTHVQGEMTGKYYGEYLPNVNDQPIYHITIYEATIHPINSDKCSCINGEKIFCEGIHKHEEGDFADFEKPVFFDKSQLPEKFTLLLPNDQLEYKIDINGLTMYNVQYLRHLHQKENKEVFGTVKCVVKGYFSDVIEEKRLQREYKPLAEQVSQPSFPNAIPQGNPLGPKPSGNHVFEDGGNTGSSNIFRAGLGSRQLSNGNWEKKNSYIRNGNTRNSNTGNKYADTGISWVFVLLALIFLLIIIPGLKFLIPIIAVILLLTLVPGKIWEWFFKIIGFLYLASIVGLIGWTVFNSFQKNLAPLIEIPKYIVASPTIKPAPKPVMEESINNNNRDTVLRFSKEWKDYSGAEYSGSYYIFKSDYQKSKSNKNALFGSNQRANYNFIVHKIKEFDQNKLDGVYKMFDSLATARNLTRLQFASMVMAFVQDYNYSLILPQECDPTIYSDYFVKNYLTKNNGSCIPNEPFGLLTPLETIATSNADCDTRTLLIYTILSKYGYDLVMLSSDLYGHSLIGINLPYYGSNYFIYGNTKYALVETTAPAARPAYIPSEIANRNNWYISLKSK
ncbi:MAG: hypothetical protein LBF27_22590 [Sphingobacterium sp.]|jgi:energy-coupling factor transporter transmembrane protein EcfT|nr:hypothetical protein [Sphingobacterium sp.]